MVTHFKPNKSRSRISVIMLYPRLGKIGEIRRTRKGLSFVVIKPLTAAALESVASYMADLPR